MKVGIMQPYFLPYIGYFQLMDAVDIFVIYDSIKYTKKGWINRNRFLLNGHDEIFSIPLRKAADNLPVVEREISEDFSPEKLIAQFQGAYRKAPYFDPTISLIRKVVGFEGRNLFDFIHHSLRELTKHLQIETPLCVSSSLNVDPNLKAESKVKAICKELKATEYWNPIGGTELYDKEDFLKDGIELKFLKSRSIEYKQLSDNFVPWLSILDVLMFNSVATIRGEYLSRYDLV